jgi:hypothetical protein
MVSEAFTGVGEAEGKVRVTGKSQQFSLILTAWVKHM